MYNQKYKILTLKGSINWAYNLQLCDGLFGLDTKWPMEYKSQVVAPLDTKQISNVAQMVGET